jgi:hypothetical protein
MAARRSKSKKRFDANCKSNKQLSAFFIDRCLGRYCVANALIAEGERVELFHNYFEDDTKDEDWLPVVGVQKWIVLTKDRHIRSNQMEVEKLIAASVPCFNFAGASATGPEMAHAFVAALPDIKRLISKIAPPFVANVTSTGNVNVLMRYSDLTKKLP